MYVKECREPSLLNPAALCLVSIYLLLKDPLNKPAWGTPVPPMHTKPICRFEVVVQHNWLPLLRPIEQQLGSLTYWLFC